MGSSQKKSKWPIIHEEQLSLPGSRQGKWNFREPWTLHFMIFGLAQVLSPWREFEAVVFESTGPWKHKSMQSFWRTVWQLLKMRVLSHQAWEHWNALTHVHTSMHTPWRKAGTYIGTRNSVEKLKKANQTRGPYSVWIHTYVYVSVRTLLTNSVTKKHRVASLIQNSKFYKTVLYIVNEYINTWINTCWTGGWEIKSWCIFLKNIKLNRAKGKSWWSQW